MMDATGVAVDTLAAEIWPALPYGGWQDTLDTLHMWTQIAGKVKLQLSPFLNEWWEVGFTITARGMTTSGIPIDRRVFQVDFDFFDHRLDILVNDGSARSVRLYPRSVADFYAEFMGALDEIEIPVRINTTPQEVEHSLPLDVDKVHASYDPTFVHRWWRIMVQVDRLLQRFRTPFVGKSSPVLFYWGAFDLNQTRYSGRPAPERAWPTRWMALTADQEHFSMGFWPGNGKVREAAFYAYMYPEPPDLRDAVIQPDPAYYHPDLGEFFLPYEAVRRAASPERLILDFFGSSYQAGATLGEWDRASLERPDPYPHRGG